MSDDTELTEAEDQPKKEKGMKPAEAVRHWLIEIDLAKKDREQFIKEGEDAERKYLGEAAAAEGCEKKANIYYGSIESTKPSIYSSKPKPDIRRRFKDNNKLARISAEQLERAVNLSLDCHQDINHVYECCRDDYLVPGRCITWERFKPTFGTEDVQIPLSMEEAERGYSDSLDRAIDAAQIQQAEDGSLFVVETKEAIVYAESVTEYVNWKDYLVSPARTTNEIRWKGRRHYLTRDELKREYGDQKKIDIDDIERTAKPPRWDDKTGSSEEQKRYTRAEVWEIWDLTTLKVYHICEGYKKSPLKVQDDPLGLKNFFPCPTECVAISTTSNVTPRSEYRAAKQQAETIDKLTTRIDALVDCIHASGVYDKAAGPEVQKVLSEDELIPIKGWAAFQQAGGWDGVVAMMPLDGIIKALDQLYKARSEELQIYYEITGYSDIMRGVTDPRETATAQEGKMQFASSRVREKQRRFQRFIKDSMAIKAEVIAEHFPPELIVGMTGMEAYQEKAEPQEYLEAAGLLRDDTTRSYLIEIETDSTIATDDQLNKQQAAEFLGAIGPYMQQVMQAQGPTLTMMGELLQFVIRQHKAGRGTEGSVEQWIGEIRQAQEDAAGQPPPPDPEMEKIQAQIQLEQMRAEAKIQSEQIKAQGQMQLEQFKMERQAMLEQQKAILDNQQQELKGRFEMLIQMIQAENRVTLEKIQAQADIAVKMADRLAGQQKPIEMEKPAAPQATFNIKLPETPTPAL